MISTFLQALPTLEAGGHFSPPWPLAWGVLLVGSLVGIFGAGSLGMTARRSLKSRVNSQMKANGPEFMPAKATASIIPATIKATAKQVGAGIAVALLGVFAGWSARDARQFHHTYVLNDLHVLEQIGSDQFVMQFHDTHQPFQTRLCAPVPPFRAGLVLKELVYEDQGSCWSIADSKLGYIFDRKESDHGRQRQAEGSGATERAAF